MMTMTSEKKDLFDDAGLGFFDRGFRGFADAGRDTRGGGHATRAQCDDSGSCENGDFFHAFLQDTTRHFADKHRNMSAVGVFVRQGIFLLIP